MNIEENFIKIYGHKPEAVYFAPGRINLIGEHIDYNGGNVFPCALTFGTKAAVSRRSDNEIWFYSLNIKETGIIKVNLNDLNFKEKDDWANYPKGVFENLIKQGIDFSHGLNILYYGDIPNGAGLSSSASITVVTTILLDDIYELNLEKIEVVKITQDVENDYMGVNTGVMDQFAITYGKENHAILLNTNLMEYDYVPISLGNHSIVIMNTNKRRGLTDSKYNERRKECEQALEIIKTKLELDFLCDLSLDQLKKLKYLFTDMTLYHRAHHAVSENERTLAAKKVLEKNDLFSFGQLMNASHKSLRDDYEVTGIELDTLVETAWKQQGCVGARVTGAGFGGCAIAIVSNNHLDEFIKAVGLQYEEKIGYAADFYIASVGDGPKKMK